MQLKILLAGDGGQGVQTISDIICQAAFKNGFFVNHIPNYGLEQRGGVSLSYITIGDKEITYPKFSMPDILLIMSEQAKERIKRYTAGEVTKLAAEDYKEILNKENIKLQNYNIFFLGILTKILVKKKVIKESNISAFLEDKLGKKDGWKESERAFYIGANL